MANTYTLISSNTLSGSAASVTFSSIPSTYTDLVLRYSARSDADGGTIAASMNMQIYLNGVTSGTSYSYTYLQGNGSATASGRASSTNQMKAPYADGLSATANSFGNGEIYIPSYTASQSRPISGFGVSETNASAAIMWTIADLYQNSTAVSQISLYPDGGNFVSGSSFYLYGIKNS